MLQEATKHNSESAPEDPKPQSLLLAFKPRQILLAQKTNTTMKNNKTTLNPHQKSLLLSSVLCYLHSNGYSKPLKRLISSAHIQDESWKACSLNLEDMFNHYLETCSSVDAKVDTSKGKELLSNGTKEDGDKHSSEEAVVKKKKKKSEDSDDIAVVAEDVELKPKEKTKKTSDSVEESLQVTEQATKEQKDKKKKSKHNNEPLESNVDSKEEVKSKDKKKKSNSSAKSEGDGEADTNAEGKSKDKNVTGKPNSELLESIVDSKEEVKSKDKKKKSDSSSKSAGDGDGDGEVDPDAEGKSKDKKKKKKKNSDLGVEKMDNSLEGETILSKDNKSEKDDSVSKNLSDGVTELANKDDTVKEEKESKKRKRSDSDGIDKSTPLTNGNHEVKGGESTGPKSGRKDTGHKSGRKDNNDSAVPKTVTAFQRVKIDDVEFADERLQDNSYWAMDGADVGYGAKAQEVLGQVRGRDFRHEKTKKKRGSYRGGQIDLHSHSVKFKYNDED